MITWNELAQKIAQLSEEQKQMAVTVVVFGDVVNCPQSFDVTPIEGELAKGLTHNQPILCDE